MKADQKPNVVILYGPMGVGKLTVAKALSKITGFKVTHNHLINDLVWSVFERRTLEAEKMSEKIRYDFYQTAIKHGKSIIITHAFSHNWVSQTGLSDPDYLKTLGKKLEKSGAKVLFVHLQADTKELMVRVKQESRKEFGKLTKPSILKELSKTRDWETTLELKNNIVINNTNLPAAKVAKMIQNFLIKQ